MENRQQAEGLIWKSDSSESMISVTIGRAISTLLSSRTKKLHGIICRLSLDSNQKRSLDSLQDSLSFCHKYIKDAIERHENLDQVLIPIIQHGLRNKDLKQAVLIINWLFEDKFVFQGVATNLANIIVRKEDRYIALGWCILVRGLVEHESFMEQYSLNGIRGNYNALLKILCSCIPRLVCIVSTGSTFRDGFELPSRLSVSAADCILTVSEALTKKTKSESNKPKSLDTNASRPVSLVLPTIKEKKVKQTSESSEVLNLEMAYLLWNQIEELTTLLQTLLAWSRKSRPLHAKGVEQVLKWLQEIKGHYGHTQDETGGNILKTGALLLSSCWKHYSSLLVLEDHKFSQQCTDLLNQYISGIQYYTGSHVEEGLTENKDGGVETLKFFLRCLCLLLGRFDNKKFETAVSENGLEISRILLSQLHCADEDVIESAVCVLKEILFKSNLSSGNGLIDSRQMDEMLPLLLHLLDERDGTARAVVMLLAEYCSMSTDGISLKQVLRRIDSGNALQRRNAIDVISEIVVMSSDSGNKISNLAWQDIANSLLERLNDEETVIREQVPNLLSVIDPSFVLPTLVHLICSTEGTQSSARASFIAMLKHHNQKPEVICMLLDCLSNLNKIPDPSKIPAKDAREGPKVDIDRLLTLIPEWSKTVQDWNPLIGPLISKMFSEPANATIVRFLSYLSEQLAEAVNEVLHHVLLQMQGQKEIDEGFLSMWESRGYKSEDSVKMQQSLFERLCPLLVIRLLPLRVFNDLSLSVLYGQLPSQGITHVSECGGVECVASLLLKRAFKKSEFEDVRKLAAELCGRIHPQVLFPIVSSLLEHAVASHDTLKIKTCLFSVCTSLVIRGRESISHPVIPQIRKMLETVLLWPSLDGDEVSKAQHGCIDCLALMICARLQAPSSFKESSENISTVRNTNYSGNVLSYVINHLVNDKNELGSASMLGSEKSAFEASATHSFRLCMANVLISACQKISDSGKKLFAQKTVPRLIQAVEGIMHPEIRAACVQIMFSAVYHLKLAVLPYSSDLLNLSLKFLSHGSEKERMAGAKLMASLMASEDVILQSISGGLLEARSVLSSISFSDPSLEMRQVCQKLLACITSP